MSRVKLKQSSGYCLSLAHAAQSNRGVCLKPRPGGETKTRRPFADGFDEGSTGKRTSRRSESLAARPLMIGISLISGDLKAHAHQSLLLEVSHTVLGTSGPQLLRRMCYSWLQPQLRHAITYAADMGAIPTYQRGFRIDVTSYSRHSIRPPAGGAEAPTQAHSASAKGFGNH